MLSPASAIFAVGLATAGDCGLGRRRLPVGAARSARHRPRHRPDDDARPPRRSPRSLPAGEAGRRLGAQRHRPRARRRRRHRPARLGAHRRLPLGDRAGARRACPPTSPHPASDGIGGAFAVAANAGDQGPAIIDAAKHAFVEGGALDVARRRHGRRSRASCTCWCGAPFDRPTPDRPTRATSSSPRRRTPRRSGSSCSGVRSDPPSGGVEFGGARRRGRRPAGRGPLRERSRPRG